jgi:Bacterial PH domain
LAFNKLLEWLSGRGSTTGVVTTLADGTRIGPVGAFDPEMGEFLDGTSIQGTVAVAKVLHGQPSRMDRVLDAVTRGVVWALKALAIVATASIVVLSFIGLAAGGWKRDLGIAVLIIGAYLLVIRMIRGPLSAPEAELSQRLTASQEYVEAELERRKDASYEATPGSGHACPPSPRLKRILDPDSDELVVIELRKSPLSMFTSTFGWVLATFIVMLAFRTLQRCMLLMNKAKKPIEMISAAIVTALLITPWVLVIWFVVAKVGGIGHFWLLLFGLCIVDLIYRFFRWRVETIVRTNQRFIAIRGVVGHDYSSIPLEQVNNVDTDEKPIGRIAGQLRLTKYVLGTYTVIAAGIGAKISVNCVPAELMLSMSLVPIAKKNVSK